MHGLHDRNVSSNSDADYPWGNERIGIVQMDDIRSKGPQHLSEERDGLQ